MRRLITIILASLSLASSAQTMRELLRSAPDTLVTLLTHNNLLDFPDYLDTQMLAQVRNRLGGNSEMTKLTDDYTFIRVTAVSTLQLKLLPQSKGKVLLSIYTCNLNDSIAESRLSFYDTSWKPLHTEQFIKVESEPNVMRQYIASAGDDCLTVHTFRPFELSFDTQTVPVSRQTDILLWNKKKFIKHKQ